MNNILLIRMEIEEEDLERFCDKFKMSDCNSLVCIKDKIDKWVIGKCWKWKGAVRNENGYCQFVFRKKTFAAHRFSYELYNGPILDNNIIMHLCDNRKCVNPYHLKQGTNKENSRDMVKKKRVAHNHGEKNGQSKLKLEDINEIKRLYKTGDYTQKELSKLFDVSTANISFIINNKRWTSKIINNTNS